MSAILLSSIGITLILLRQTSYGVGLVVDSLTHTSTAESLSRGEGFITAWNSRPQQGQPPLYALALALIAMLSIGNKTSITEYASYLGAAAFGITILVSIAWATFRIVSRKLIIVFGCILTFSPFLGEIFSYALTEVLFVLATVLALFTLDRFLINQKKSMLVLAATLASFAWLTRHLGVTIIITALIILVTRSNLTSRQRFSSAATYFTLSTLPAILWMFKNYILLGHLTERRWPTDFIWDIHLHLAFSELTKWIVGITGFNYLNELSEVLGINTTLVRAILWIIMLTFLGSSFVYLRKKGLQIKSEGLIVPGVFILVYSISFSVPLILSDVAFEPRYLSPIYVPIMVVTFITIDQCATFRNSQFAGRSSSKHHYASILRVTVVAGLALHLVLAAFSSYEQIKRWRDQGFNYSSEAWVSSETIRYLESNPIEGWIYSNEARAVYIYMSIVDDAEVYYHQLQAELPRGTLYWDDKARADDLDMHVVWFHGWKPFIQTRYDFTQLQSLLKLEIVTVLEDGIVFKASSDPAVGTYQPGGRSDDSTFEAILQGAEHIVSSTFDIYSDGLRLIYSSTSCNELELEDPFFLHIFPTDRSNISSDGAVSDFNNHDFRFDREGFSFGERCAVIRNLPDYDIDLIRTGQFSDDGSELWEESIQVRRKIDSS